MDGELERGPAQNDAIKTARQSVDEARERLAREKKESARRELGGWFAKIRENPLMRGPMKRLAALFLGIPLSANAAEVQDKPNSGDLFVQSAIAYPERAESQTMMPTEPEQIALIHQLMEEESTIHSRIETEATFESEFPETDQFYLWELKQIARTIERGEAAPEYYARVGRPEWTPYHRALFADAPVRERFTELHPEYRSLEPRQFLASFPEQLALAKTEFRFSNEYRFLTEDAITLFAQEAPNMDPEEALALYKTLSIDIGRNVGLASVISLESALKDALPADHPILAYARASGIEEATKFVAPSRDTFIHVDQASGELRVMRAFGKTYVLLDSFPAIGGQLSSPELGKDGHAPNNTEFVHVPDMVLAVGSVDRAKTSWNWVNSWVPGGAPIREHGDQLQYQHPGNKQWYDLTGENAAFFPDATGTTIKPFDRHVEPLDLALVRSASHASPDGATTFVPKAWTKEEIMQRAGGEVPASWEWNDFGSMSIRLSVGGERTNINIHSKPGEDENGFLSNRTHGCFATYGAYVKELADVYGVRNGTKVVSTTTRTYDLNALLGK